MKEICLIGATGSVGKQTLSVIERNKDKFRIKSIVANSSCNDFLEAVEKFRPSYAALANESVGRRIKNRIPAGVKFGYGEQAALDAVAYGDTTVVACGGFAGLKYALKAIELKKDIALANKETLVCGGEMFMKQVKESGVNLTPIDSEHSAIWQALDFDCGKPFRRLILTASGGPFYGKTRAELETVTVKDALKHPTWNMGEKITIDSATMLNKGFEVIEAHHLFGAPLEKIEVIVHPESIIHSMVEFVDGSTIAQMSYPSMEQPIQLALSYPERFMGSVKPLDFARLGSLRFLPMERKQFPCFHLALSALEDGDNYPCSLNGAGEVAVAAFLNKKIPFTAIAEVIESALCATKRRKANSYEVLAETDKRARILAAAAVEKYAK